MEPPRQRADSMVNDISFKQLPPDRNGETVPVDHFDEAAYLNEVQKGPGLGTKVANVAFSIVAILTAPIWIPLLVVGVILNAALVGFEKAAGAIKEYQNEIMAEKAAKREPADLTGKNDLEIASIIKQQAAKGKERYYISEAKTQKNSDEFVSTYTVFYMMNKKVMKVKYEFKESLAKIECRQLGGTSVGEDPPTSFEAGSYQETKAKNFEEFLREKETKAKRLQKGDMPQPKIPASDDFTLHL